MTNETLLLIAFIMFLLGYYLAYKTDTKWLYMLSGLLWFVPIFLIENIFIIIFSITMIIFSGLIAFTQEE